MSTNSVAFLMMGLDIVVLGACVFALGLKCDRLMQEKSDLHDENRSLRAKVSAYERLIPTDN